MPLSSRLARAACLALCAGVGWRAAAQQSSAQGTGLILGRVVDAGTGRPVAGALVTARGATAQGPAQALAPQQVLTSDDGYFVFRSLSKGDFTLRTLAAGYLSSDAGVAHAGGSARPVSLADGEKISDVVIRLWKTAAITGQLTDERGEGVEGVSVNLLRVDAAGGRRRFSVQTSVTSDDRGVYRFASLVPGDYAVCAIFSRHVATLKPGVSPYTNGSGALANAGSGYQIGDLILISSSGSRNLDPAPDEHGGFSVFADACYSGAATVPAAQTLALTSGDERAGVNLTLRLVPAARLSGIVIGPSGPVGGIGVHLLPAAPDDALVSSVIEAATTETDVSGAFGFIGLPAGSYVLKVTYVSNESRSAEALIASVRAAGGVVAPALLARQGAPRPAPASLWASQPVAVDHDVDGVVLTLRDGARVGGRIAFDGAANRPDAAALANRAVMFDAAGDTSIDAWTSPAGTFAPDGTFQTPGLLPGSYRLHVSGGDFPGWRLKSIVVNGRDASVDPIDIGSTDVTGVVVTFTDRPTELAGIVTAAGEPDGNAAVVVFPADRAKWSEFSAASRQETSTRTSRTGAYTFTNLPAGEYLVAAIDDRLDLTWQDPKVLDLLSRTATRVRLADAEKRALNLTTSSIR